MVTRRGNQETYRASIPVMACDTIQPKAYPVACYLFVDPLGLRTEGAIESRKQTLGI
ncbi:MAG: hypothetical protein ACK5EO_12635 [Planctomycetota bacterium]